MPGKLPNLGPQDIERGVVDSSPSPQVEGLLCALLGLVLNRKKPVEYVYTEILVDVGRATGMVGRHVLIEFNLQAWSSRTSVGRGCVVAEVAMAVQVEGYQSLARWEEL